jgi:hypothetical protein
MKPLALGSTRSRYNQGASHQATHSRPEKHVMHQTLYGSWTRALRVRCRQQKVRELPHGNSIDDVFPSYHSAVAMSTPRMQCNHNIYTKLNSRIIAIQVP